MIGVEKMKMVDGKFIYVFTFEAKNKLIDAGFVLLKADQKNSIYCFKNQPDEYDVLDTVSYIVSNKLTF